MHAGRSPAMTTESSSTAATRPITFRLLNPSLLANRILLAVLAGVATVIILAAYYPYLTSSNSDAASAAAVALPIDLSTTPLAETVVTADVQSENNNNNKRSLRRRRGKTATNKASDSAASATSVTTTATESSPPSFYDNPSLSYTFDTHETGWDEKRTAWLRDNNNIGGKQEEKENVLMITGAQHGRCDNPEGDHFLLRFYRNKADYCRIHDIDLFYNNELLHPSMPGCWAKLPVLRAAMIAHPEAEWLWWVDSDAAFSDMEFFPPLSRYAGYNLVVPGWPSMVYGERNWVGLNAGVFLLRNCQWSLDFLAAWAMLGPQSPDHGRWGRVLDRELVGKITVGSDDQAAMIHVLLRDQQRKWRRRTYFESEYDLHGFWASIVGGLENITKGYLEMERSEANLRRRRAEKHAGGLLELRRGQLANARRQRPFVTHFVGCQPCGDSGWGEQWARCASEMRRVLNFADSQVLRSFGFVRTGMLDGDPVRPRPFDFPAVQRRRSSSSSSSSPARSSLTTNAAGGKGEADRQGSSSSSSRSS